MSECNDSHITVAVLKIDCLSDYRRYGFNSMINGIWFKGIFVPQCVKKPMQKESQKKLIQKASRSFRNVNDFVLLY